ncbi:hypothetical protein [Terrarubrum flagellatum]|uniref:hypothetical protein n=1 Tax=Terrirubrum flagellatum TaxID=2895980 RepID=UPI003144EB0F
MMVSAGGGRAVRGLCGDSLRRTGRIRIGEQSETAGAQRRTAKDRFVAARGALAISQRGEET